MNRQSWSDPVFTVFARPADNDRYVKHAPENPKKVRFLCSSDHEV